MTAVRAVIFDAGLTLVRPEPSFAEAFAAACATVGITVDAADVAAADHLWADQHEHWSALGEPSPWEGDEDAETRYFHALYARFLTHLRIDHAGAAVERVFERLLDHTSFGAFPDAAPALRELRDRGTRLAVLSNWGTRLGLRDVLDHAGLLDLFDAVVVSGEVRVSKPSGAAFALAVERLGEPAGPHVAHVGDDLTADVAGARAAGLTAVLIDRQGRHPGHPGPRVTTLTELPEVLQLGERGGDADARVVRTRS